MTAETGAAQRPPIPERILAGRVIAIGRKLPPASVLTIADALRQAGVGAFEITMNTVAAEEAIAAVAARFDPAELLIGAGTVLDPAQAQNALDAGARFFVMPNTDTELIRWAAERSIPTFPGAFTPSEILAAWRAGAAAVKLFPASVVGPRFIREMAGPFQEIPLVPVGGVTLETAPVFIEAGAVAVGIGSWLLGGGDPATIRDRAGQLLAALQPAPPASPAAPRPDLSESRT